MRQASRVKFVFGPDALKVVIGEQQEEFENAFVGGANEWKYDTFTNWEFWCVACALRAAYGLDCSGLW